MPVTASQRIHRILRRLSSFSPEVGDSHLQPIPEARSLLGGIFDLASGELSVVLLESGAQFESNGEWHYVPYSDIAVSFPPKGMTRAGLQVHTPSASFEVLPGSNDLWEVGRFLMRCASDAAGAA